MPLTGRDSQDANAVVADENLDVLDTYLTANDASAFHAARHQAAFSRSVTRVMLADIG